MNKKTIIITGIGFGIIIIFLIVYLILTLTTDLFKPSSEIFQRYLKESIENINQILDLSKEQEYINTLIQNNYKDNTKVEFRYKNSQENVENFSLTSEGITNNSEKNSYRTINIKYGENYNVMNVEYLQENQTYGILFSNVVKQFISADIDNLEKIKSLIGIDIKELEKTDVVEFLNFIIKDKENVKNAFLKYIQKLGNNRYSMQKEKSITLNNGETKNVKEYLLSLTEEETKELYIEILKVLGKQSVINKITEDKTQFPKVNLALYVVDKKTISAAIEIDNKQFKMDFYEKQLDIKYNAIEEEKIKNVNIDLKKEEQSTIVKYTDSYNNKVNLMYDMGEDANKKNAKIRLSYQNDYIKGIALELNQDIEIKDGVIEGIEKKFKEQPNANITEFSDNKRSSAIKGLLERIDALLVNENNQVNSEFINIWIQINKEIENEYQGIKEKLKKEFNNQFLVYKGQNVEKEVLYNLLDLSGLNMEKYEETGEDSFRIYISQGTNNMSLAQEIKNKIEKSSKVFNVNFGFNSEGKVNSIDIYGYDKQ